MNLNQVTLPCRNLDKSLAFYEALGCKLIVLDKPRYARFECESGATFSLHLSTSASLSSEVVVYFEVQDLDAEVERLKAEGIVFDSGPAMQTWLWREAHLRDPAGNHLCLFFAGENRRHPPWRLQ